MYDTQNPPTKYTLPCKSADKYTGVFCRTQCVTSRSATKGQMNQISISNNKRKKRKNNNNNVLILGSHQLCSFSRDLQVLSCYILSKKPKKIPRNYREGYSVCSKELYLITLHCHENHAELGFCSHKNSNWVSDFCDSTVKLSRHADLKIRASRIG